jgi:hypothetical protein
MVNNYSSQISRNTSPFYDVFPLNEVGFNQNLPPMVMGIEVTSGGSLEFETFSGKTRTLPVETGRIYPIAVKKILNGSSMNAGQIYCYLSPL